MSVPQVLNRNVPCIDIEAQFGKSYFRPKSNLNFLWSISTNAQRTYVLGTKLKLDGSGLEEFSKPVLYSSQESIVNFPEDCWRELGAVLCGRLTKIRQISRTVKKYFNFFSTAAYVYGVSWNMVERSNRVNGSLDSTKYEPDAGWSIVPGSLSPVGGEDMVFAEINESSSTMKIVKLNSVSKVAESSEYSVLVGQWQQKVDVLYSSDFDRIYVVYMHDGVIKGLILDKDSLNEITTMEFGSLSFKASDYVMILDIVSGSDFKIVYSSLYNNLAVYDTSGLLYDKPVSLVTTYGGYFCGANAIMDVNGDVVYSHPNFIWDFIVDNDVIYFVSVDENESPTMANLYSFNLGTMGLSHLGKLIVLPENGEQWFGKLWLDMSNFIIAGLYSLDGKKIARKFSRTSTGQNYTISL